MYSSAVELQAMPQDSRVNLCLGARRKGTIQVGAYFLMFAEILKTVAIKLQVLLPMRGSISLGISSHAGKHASFSQDPP